MQSPFKEEQYNFFFLIYISFKKESYSTPLLWKALGIWEAAVYVSPPHSQFSWSQLHPSPWPRYQAKHLGADSIPWWLGMRSGDECWDWVPQMAVLVVPCTKVHPGGWVGLKYGPHFVWQTMSPWSCVCPVGAPFSNSLQGTIWAHCGTVCVYFFQSGWHHYFLISVKLLYFTSHIISKRSWTSKDFLNYHIRHNNTTTILQRN